MKCRLLLLIFIGAYVNDISAVKIQRPEPRKRVMLNIKEKLKHISSVVTHLNEPITFLKGPNRRIAFKVPKEFLAKRFQNLDLIDRSSFTSEVQEIDIKPIRPPDLTIPMKLGRRENFSTFLPKHQKMAAHLIEILMEMPDAEDFLSASIFCRERINPYMFVYALSVALIHRPDTQHIRLPPLAEVFPDRYLDGGIFSQARQEANCVPAGSRVPIEIPKDYTASDLEPEHRLSYFREDVGINLLHWYWHTIYPNEGPISLANKDRRGELFQYFHQQIVARYNFERLSNSLARVRKLNNWYEPVEEAYFPKLNNLIASRIWASRDAFTKLHDIHREIDQLTFDIQDLERWRDRIYSAIHQKAAINDRGEVVDLSGDTGIDILANMVQSSVLSINRDYYGVLHNLGHLLIAYIHDPDGRHLEQFGVMADIAVAMRDPTFYRWHQFIDDIFQDHKKTLPGYTVNQLNFHGVVVSAVEVITENAPLNEFATFWQKSDIDLSRGLDFVPAGPLFARVTHLQHAPFVFKIQIQNSGRPQRGTVRIFMAPKFDERGLTMLFRDQRRLFIEMDKFPVEMNTGNNIFRRESKMSSVAVPSTIAFRNLNATDPNDDGDNFCGCGWPLHMMVPKGTPEGLPVELFVMVSNYAHDVVEQPPPEGCHRSHSYCGLRNRLYPDKRPMGFPFDRMPREGVNTLYEFLTPNMAVIDLKIRFQNKIIPPKLNVH